MKNSSVDPECVCVFVCVYVRASTHTHTHTHTLGNQRKARVQFPHLIFYQREAIKGLLYKLY